MSLAVRVVAEKIGPVFMLREGAEVHEGDVAFAATLFPDVPCYFFVDQAREHANALQTALAQQKKTPANCLFVAGARRNEWLTAKARPPVEEFAVWPLSDAEIDRVLDFLGAEKALGEMQHLDRSFQVQIVKTRHEKELLVAMREATAGEKVGFDAIIESEYRGIEKGGNYALFAHELYLLVCCFYQHGVLIRDRLLEDVLGRPLHTMHQEIGSSLDGLIDYTEINNVLGEYAARARHRTIAEIVWKKCGTHDRKEALLQTAMEKLNLSYRLDKIVFDKFIRSDEIVETFRTFEGKTRFFETGCRREPDNPYVLQHYARMLLREGRHNLALSQIERAIAKDKQKTIRSLRHTKGNVLAELATSASSIDVGRKWLAQSEREFHFCITAQEKDDFGHSGLANLYLGWARKVPSDNEATEYLAKAEGVISAALRVVKERTSLLIVSAAIQAELGNQPARLSKLREAVTSNSESIISRYLLARAYRDQGHPEKTIEVLDPVIKTAFSEVRAYLEYTRAMLEMKEPIQKCAATLKQCRLDGISDPVFVALYGGLLYLDEKYDDAKRLWDDARDQDFTLEDAKRTQYEPMDPTDPKRPLRVEGIVDGVKPSYIFVQPPTGPTILSSSTMINGKILQRGMPVTYRLTFSAKGAYADDLKLV